MTLSFHLRNHEAVQKSHASIILVASEQFNDDGMAVTKTAPATVANREHLRTLNTENEVVADGYHVTSGEIKVNGTHRIARSDVADRRLAEDVLRLEDCRFDSSEVTNLVLQDITSHHNTPASAIYNDRPRWQLL